MQLEPYLRALGGGALIGLAASIALVAHGRIAGASGILQRALDRDGRAFRIAFLVGLIVTGALAACAAPSAFGVPARGLPAIAIGGLLCGVGTTLGNGCTSGHGVCGLSRGAPRSMVAVGTFMLTAALTVALLGARA
jgi:uncharacterized membrane protein YedE/YeeE